MRVVILALGFISSTAAQEDNLQSHMLEHFARATQVQSAVVAGDFKRAAERSQWLVQHVPPDSLPKGWEPYVQTLQELAMEVQHTTSIIVAAGATADMARACGDCHQQFEARTWFTPSTEPPAGTSLVSRMARHQWAADRLWEGLIGPSDDAWYAGAEALAEAPLSAREVLGEDEGSADYLTNRVHELGRQARKTARYQSRARLYGHLLSTCAECHNLYRSR